MGAAPPVGKVFWLHKSLQENSPWFRFSATSVNTFPMSCMSYWTTSEAHSVNYAHRERQRVGLPEIFTYKSSGKELEVSLSDPHFTHYVSFEKHQQVVKHSHNTWSCPIGGLESAIRFLVPKLKTSGRRLYTRCYKQWDINDWPRVVDGSS